MVVILNSAELAKLLGKALGLPINDVLLEASSNSVVLQVDALTIPELYASIKGPSPNARAGITLPGSSEIPKQEEISVEEMTALVNSSRIPEDELVVEYVAGEVIRRPRSEEEAHLPPGEPIQITYPS